MTITLSEQEAQVLVQLIDMAVKSGGLNVAQAAVVLTQKITDAAKPAEVETDSNI